MEPEWSMVELLDCIDNELDPGRDVEPRHQSSQAIFTAIRVLPAPEAGDLFVTAAARGNIGAVLFYVEEGERPLFPLGLVGYVQYGAYKGQFIAAVGRHGGLQWK